MTLLESAKAGKMAPIIQKVAGSEKIEPELLRQLIANGKAVTPSHQDQTTRGACAIGLGLRTKVNANIGTSPDFVDLEVELAKLRAAEEVKTDAVMDLSTGGDIPGIRKAILERARVPVGTVPIYEAAARALSSRGSLSEMKPSEMIRAFEEHARDGVDFFVVHAAITRSGLEQLRKSSRICGIVSRGGTFLAQWMLNSGKENPLYENFEELLAIAREYDVTLSLGDALRPGSLADAFDTAQVTELMVQAELVRRANEAGVQAMVEGPGHVPLDQIEAQVRLEKEMCHGAPFYVLGPLVTDVAVGYDHISSAIGGAIAAAAGADFLCYVTPTEHVGLPSVDHVREGVIAARIAAHAGDIAKGIRGAADWDREFSEMRRKRDWPGQLSHCIDPQRAAQLRHEAAPRDQAVCSMCGEFCVFKLADQAK